MLSAFAKLDTIGATSLTGSFTSHKTQPSSEEHQPANGHHVRTLASPLDALPSSPTRSRVSASMAEPTSNGAGSATQLASPGDDATIAHSPINSSNRVQINDVVRQRGDQSVETAKTISQMAKERPIIQKAHSYRFERPPPPMPDDSMSGTHRLSACTHPPSPSLVRLRQNPLCDPQLSFR